MLIRISSILFLALAFVGTACGDDDEDNAVPDATCKEIGSTCHDVSTELGQECHELGHEGDAAVCAERKDECLTYCSEFGAGGAGGQGGGGGEGGSE